MRHVFADNACEYQAASLKLAHSFVFGSITFDWCVFRVDS
jgi:hypothetical protein